MRAQPVGTDVKIWGGLLLIIGTMDLILTALFPGDRLTLFGTFVTGPASFLIALHSSAVCLLIGYGFLWLRPWAWGLSLAYAGFAMVSETMNQLVFGHHIMGSAFIVTTLLFVLYLIWRRAVFVDEPMPGGKPKRASQELL